MGLLTNTIKDEHGKEQEVLNGNAKLLIALFFGGGVIGTNTLSWNLSPTEQVQSAPIAVVEKMLEDKADSMEQMLDTKLIQKDAADQEVEIEQMKADIIDHFNRDSRITTNERRVQIMEDNYIVQQKVLLEIRDATKEE
jgi:hypothetical protein